MYVVDSGIRTTHQEFVSASTGQKRATFGWVPAFCALVCHVLTGCTALRLACRHFLEQGLYQWWLITALLLHAGWTSLAIFPSHLPFKIVSAPLFMCSCTNN